MRGSLMLRYGDNIYHRDPKPAASFRTIRFTANPPAK
jgi:hypothetical protein